MNIKWGRLFWGVSQDRLAGSANDMHQIRLIWIIAAKDLRIEYRTKQAFLTTLFFALLILLIFSFAFDPGDQAVRAAAPGMLWVSLLFPGIIQLNRSFQSEREEGTFYGIILSPVDRGVLFLGKFLANWIFLILIDILILFAFLILFNLSVRSGLLWLLLVLLLADVAFTAVGTLFAAMVSSISTREVLLPILLFPIMVPILLAAVGATREILSLGEWQVLSNWIRLLSGADVILTVGSFLVFDYVIGD